MQVFFGHPRLRFLDDEEWSELLHKLDGVVEKDEHLSIRHRLSRKTVAIAATITAVLLYTFHGPPGEPIRFIRKPW